MSGQITMRRTTGKSCVDDKTNLAAADEGGRFFQIVGETFMDSWIAAVV